MKSIIHFLASFIALLLIIPVAGADWSDNFDSYDNGSGLHGQGGWAGWQGDSTFDATVTDAQSLSAPNSVEIAPTSDIVHEFDETGGEWEMTASCYIPSGSTGMQYFIMLNQYYPDTNNWSVTIKFDSDAGIVQDIYSGNTTSIINDQWIELRADIHLDANTYEMYYNDIFLTSWIWQNGGGSNAIAALDLFSDGGSAIYWDDCKLVQIASLEQTTWGSIKTLIQ